MHYKNLIENKYRIYNSLFMQLPYEKMRNIGMLLPFLGQESDEGFKSGKKPKEIMNAFFEAHAKISDKKERHALLFRFIQYIERQVVLFDAVEDAAFEELAKNDSHGSMEHLERMVENASSPESLKKALEDYAVRIVFTAHPTQFYPNDVLRIINDLRLAIDDDDLEEIDLLLQQLGKTPFLNTKKPTPYDEAMSIMYFMRTVYYQSIGRLYGKIKSKWGIDNPNLLELGFWPGGDRDGNPFVTAEITSKVANQLRLNLLKCYYNHLKQIRRRISFMGVKGELDQLKNRMYNNMFGQEDDLRVEDIKASLENVKNILTTQHDGLFTEILEPLIERVDLFGLHFASLDIRQDSSVHRRIIREIFEQEFALNYDEVSPEEKIRILTEEKRNLNPNDYQDERTQDTLKNVYQLREIQKANGPKSIHRYIISNSEDELDVLMVYGLFRFCGYEKEQISFDIIPLFETIKGLSDSEKTMQTLYDLPVYSSHLTQRAKQQTIMLGFSDGTKDGGYLKANWEIFKTKETLTQVSQRNGYSVVFFDGRGGPPARGGGKTHKFYAAQGPTISSKAIQLTIQGQTITSMFGNISQATHNLERLLTSGLMNRLVFGEKNRLTSEQRTLFDELANVSYEKYTALKEHALFVPYLEEMSTVKFYGRTNIGSRPSKRGKNDDGLRFKDLRAIPFVGSWALLKQNVPGYYGLGTALNELKKQNRFEEAKLLFKESEFFKALVLNSMMSLEKTRFDLTAYMQQHPRFGPFWEILYAEFELSRSLLLEVSGLEELMEGEPMDKQSIAMREQIVLPLLAIQQYALEGIQDKDEYLGEYEKLVTRALFGNINANRNSA